MTETRFSNCAICSWGIGLGSLTIGRLAREPGVSKSGAFPGGCFLAQILAVFDGQTGPLHDTVASGHPAWLGLMEDQVIAAQERNELDPALDPRQFAFELWAPLELANYLATLYRVPTITDWGQAALQATIARELPRTGCRERVRSRISWLSTVRPVSESCNPLSAIHAKAGSAIQAAPWSAFDESGESHRRLSQHSMKAGQRPVRRSAHRA